MRRGFKAQAERMALAARMSLGIEPMGPLDPWRYAKSLGIEILDFESLALTPRCKRQLLVTDSESWSGMTLRINDAVAIVLNPAHSKSRQTSTLMHEISHVELKHVPTRVDISDSGILLVSEYPEDAEAEADWLSSAMLLPRDALLFHRTNGASPDEIARIFGVSRALCEWRLRMTGVDVQRRRAALRAF